MKLKLQYIVVMCPGVKQDAIFKATEIVEHDELTNGIVIKGTSGLVYKYVNVPYLIVREPV